MKFCDTVVWIKADTVMGHCGRGMNKVQIQKEQKQSKVKSQWGQKWFLLSDRSGI